MSDVDATTRALISDILFFFRKKKGVAVVGVPLSVFQNDIDDDDRAKLRAFVDVLVGAPATLDVAHLEAIEGPLEKMHACWRRLCDLGAASCSARDVLYGMQREINDKRTFACNGDIPSRVKTYVHQSDPAKRAALLKRWKKADGAAGTTTTSNDDATTKRKRGRSSESNSDSAENDAAATMRKRGRPRKNKNDDAGDA